MKSIEENEIKRNSEKSLKLSQEEKLLFSQTKRLYEELRSYQDSLCPFGEESDCFNTQCIECADIAYKLCQMLARNGYKQEFYECFFLYNSRYPEYIHNSYHGDLIEKMGELLFFIQCNRDSEGAIDKTKDIEFSLYIPLGDDTARQVWLRG